jgi:hypothetical protein
MTLRGAAQEVAGAGGMSVDVGLVGAGGAVEVEGVGRVEGVG